MSSAVAGAAKTVEPGLTNGVAQCPGITNLLALLGTLVMSSHANAQAKPPTDIIELKLRNAIIERYSKLAQIFPSRAKRIQLDRFRLCAVSLFLGQGRALAAASRHHRRRSRLRSLPAQRLGTRGRARAPKFEQQVCTYVDFGVMWGGGPVPTVNDPGILVARRGDHGATVAARRR